MADNEYHQWQDQPSEYELAQWRDIQDVINEYFDFQYENGMSPEPEQEWILYFQSGNSITFSAPPGAAEDISYGWQIYPASQGSKFTNPDYQFSDDDMVELDIPRAPYRSQSRPERRENSRTMGLPGPDPHRIDVRPRRRGPRMPREYP